MKKTIIRMFAVVLLLVGMLGVQASAFSETDVETAVVPRYTGISLILIDIDVNAYGRANCISDVEVREGYMAYVKVTLQQSEDGNDWSDVKSWAASGEGRVAVNKNYYVDSGYYYRTQCEVSIYTTGGTYIEADVNCSGEEYY